MSNFSSMLKVEIEVPRNGWTKIRLNAEQSSYVFFPSNIPTDSISQLVKAVLEILNGKEQARVYWNDEPIEHNFVFKVENEICEFGVYEVFESVAGNKLEERFHFRGTKFEVMRPFWKALCDLRSRQSPDEYEKHWRNPFPTNEMLEIKLAFHGHQE